MNSTALLDKIENKKCYNCGKKLTIFDAFYHPTLGKHIYICGICFDKVWDSEVRWGRFVIWNSFDNDAPDITYIDAFPFPDYHKKMLHRNWRKKIFRRGNPHHYR